jgi:RHS repeat-associated protein
LRPKGSNAGTPLGITGTTTGNPANGATAANANNVGNNTTANRVNVEIYYIHPDHLGTPRVVTRSTIATGANAPSSATSTSPGAINKATWRRESDPFGTLLGNSAPNENPQIITGTATQVQAATFIYDEMFPGQHWDRESGKFYNYFRDYDAGIGRYSTSDPIGLRAGSNTYGYVWQSPVTKIDPFGLYGCKWFGLILICDFTDPPILPIEPRLPPSLPKLPPTPVTLCAMFPATCVGALIMNALCKDRDEEGYEKCVKGCSYLAYLKAERCKNEFARDPAGYRKCEADVWAGMEICVIGCGAKHGI